MPLTNPYNNCKFFTCQFVIAFHKDSNPYYVFLVIIPNSFITFDRVKKCKVPFT